MSGTIWDSGYRCPHCGVRHGTDHPYCADNLPWKRAEKDEWRALIRRHRPEVKLVLSNAGERR